MHLAQLNSELGLARNELAISEETRVKANIVKAYIEDKYQQNIQNEKKKKEDWNRLVAKMKENDLSAQEQERIKNNHLGNQAKLNREM